MFGDLTIWIVLVAVVVGMLALVHMLLCSRAVELRVPEFVSIVLALLAIALLTVRLAVRAREAAKRARTPH